MKKSLIALAVLAAAGAASAQSSVQLYGIADLSLVKDKGAATQMLSGAVSGSRFGVKGSEDLGGGLKANFVLEQGFDASNGAADVAGQAFEREASVGVSGAFGAVKVGRAGTAFDDVVGATNPVFDSALSPTGVFQGYTGRTSNGVYYTSPSYAGFTAGVSYAFAEGLAAKNVTAYNVQYANGPIAAAFAQQDDDVAAAKFTRLNGSYDLGVVKLLGAYGRVKANATGDKTNEYSIGADVPLASNLVLSAGYAASKADGEERASSVSVGVAYLLSKRTTVYGGLRNDNDNGPVDSRVAVGVKHAF